MRKPKFSVGDSVRIFKECGKFHRGYLRDFTIENFTSTKVLENLPVPRYKLEILKTRGKGKNKES